MTKKFPKLIHVTRENPDDEPYLQVHEGGVFEAAEAGESKPCAIYQLVDVGVVIAPPKFVPAKVRKVHK